MMKNFTLLIIAIINITCFTNAQNPQWIIYDTINSGLTGNNVSTIAIDEDGTKWLGVEYSNGQSSIGAGLTAFDGSNWTVYDTSNSGLPENRIQSIAIENNGTKWIGTWSEGLATFDGSDWTIYDTSNSDLPDNYIQSIAIGNDGIKWIGTRYGGLATFDGSNWTIYNTSNSDLPDNDVTSIAIDNNGTKWIGTLGGGLAIFDGNSWTVYDTYNSGLGNNYILSVALEDNGTKWVGTQGGLAAFDGLKWAFYNTMYSNLPCPIVTSLAVEGNGTKWMGTVITPGPVTGCGLTSFDNSNWTTFNTSNSGLPKNHVWSIVIQDNGTKWLGTSDGLAAFNENGIPVRVDELAATSLQSAFKIYPNPARNNISILIDPEIEAISFEVINAQGKAVIYQEVKHYNVIINVGYLPNGLYIVRILTSKGFEVKKLIIQ